MAVFSKGGVTSPDLYIGTSCICLVFLCTVLNSLVFRHNYHKKSSVARTLYLILSATDLLTSWVLLMAYSVHILKECNPDSDVHCGEENYFGLSSKSSAGLRVHTIVSWTMSLSPTHITAFLAVTRCFQIKYPFRRLELKYLVLVLFLTIVWIPVVVGSAMLDVGGHGECSFPVQINIICHSWNFCPLVFGIRLNSLSFYLLMTSVTTLLQVGAMLVSILTIHELVKVYLNPVSEGTRRKDNKTRSSVKILVTNLGSMISVLLIVTTATRSSKSQVDDITLEDGIFYLLLNTIVPAFISTLNPIIYIILTPECSLKFKAISNSVGQSAN